MADDTPALPPAVKSRRRSVREEEGLSFGARRQMVMESRSMEVVESKIDGHISSCDGFRKLLIAIVIGALGMFGATIGVLYNSISNIDQRISLIDGRQQVVLSRISTIDGSFSSLREEITNRLSAVVAANSQREATFNERFGQLFKDQNAIEKEFYEYRINEAKKRDDESNRRQR